MVFLYLTLTRLDISYAVHHVFQFMQHSGDAHLTVVKWIFCYLKGTISLGLHFVRAPITAALCGYCGADWVGSKDDRRSTTGFAIFMGNNLLSWGAKKQATVSHSITEVEYRGLATLGIQLLLLH